MTHFRRDDVSSFEYIDAIPTNPRSSRQKKLWRNIAIGVTALIVIVIVIVVAVVVSQNKKDKSNGGGGQYPISPYAHMTQLVTVNDADIQQKERIFVVGDIHGCLTEFNQLLTTINYDPVKDQMILAGDITTKGPATVGVIRRAQELGMLCVRGNHDDKVVRLKAFELEKGRNAMTPLTATMYEGGVPDPIKFKNYHVAISTQLTQSDFDYLASCPVMLHLPGLNNTVVAHGGLDPKIESLQDQVPYLVMNMRDIESSGRPSPESGVGTSWATLWNTKMSTAAASEKMNVYYGHDAGRGLNIQTNTFGLDSGCVYGDYLTAMDIRTGLRTQVKCKNYDKKGGSSED
ncbi:Metallo-dependent phosphatase-like protein [Helicostylum pulchrum]|uniref:Calcineurin-like phosphoesterase domain-containing protein n=1 Tax=Helicostylum pulchrum TaxID=562976 RepID=A0ABP9XMR3_9FUNG|nr:Metallo-dependent phosphatase-like protein [Helicostylum pulchrum]